MGTRKRETTAAFAPPPWKLEKLCKKQQNVKKLLLSASSPFLLQLIESESYRHWNFLERHNKFAENKIPLASKSSYAALAWGEVSHIGAKNRIFGADLFLRQKIE